MCCCNISTAHVHQHPHAEQLPAFNVSTVYCGDDHWGATLRWIELQDGRRCKGFDCNSSPIILQDLMDHELPGAN